MKYLLDHINEIFPCYIKTRGNYKDNKQHKYLITKILIFKNAHSLTPFIQNIYIKIRVTFIG